MTLPVLKNTDGNPSSSFTMMIVAFTVVTLWLLLSMAETLGPLHVRAFSGSDAMAYLSPILALYWGRRHQMLQQQQGTGAATTTTVVTSTTDGSDDDGIPPIPPTVVVPSAPGPRLEVITNNKKGHL